MPDFTPYLKMSKAALRQEFEKLLIKRGVTFLYGGPRTKDELLAAISEELRRQHDPSV